MVDLRSFPIGRYGLYTLAESHTKHRQSCYQDLSKIRTTYSRPSFVCNSCIRTSARFLVVSVPTPSCRVWAKCTLRARPKP